MQQKFAARDFRARLPAPALRRRPERERSLIAERRARARRADPSLAPRSAPRQLLAKETRLLHPSGHDKAFGQRPLEAEAPVIGLVADQQHGAMIARARPSRLVSIIAAPRPSER